MIVLVDHYDSFTHNLAQGLEASGAEVWILRADDPRLAGALPRETEALVLSPGPGRPEESPQVLALVKRLGGQLPVLGVCLGHQTIGAVFGARTVRAARPMHGKTSEVFHRGDGIFAGLPSPFVAARYHSLVLERGSLPAELEVTAWTEDGDVMAIRHRALAIDGVQFHPESYMTDVGARILENFVAATARGRHARVG